MWPPDARQRLEALSDRLRREGRAHALATVVRTVDATAARPGARALLDAQGRLLEGWVGGGCARGAIGGAARAALASGQPQFLSLRPEDLLDAEGVHPGDERAGVRFARNGCPSRGSMDVFVEPVLPRPRLVICGAGPVALALADLAGRFDFDRTLCAPGADAAGLPSVEHLCDSVAPEAAEPADDRSPPYVVIATQGQGDVAALRAAIAAPAAYLAFVGSRRKFAALAERLAAEGTDDQALARVAAPAGLDIRAITPEEIALSILAQIVARRRAGDRPPQADGPAP